MLITTTLNSATGVTSILSVFISLLFIINLSSVVKHYTFASHHCAVYILAIYDAQRSVKIKL